MLPYTKVKYGPDSILYCVFWTLSPGPVFTAARQVKQVYSTIICSVERLSHEFLYSTVLYNRSHTTCDYFFFLFYFP